MESTKPPVNRRGLLRRASTVAAGLGAAGLATAATASPAQAATGPVNLDTENFGDGTTALIGGTNNAAALRLANAGTGAPLELEPVEFVAPATPGTTYTDSWGDIHVTGSVDDQTFDNMHYSPTWATMVYPVQSFRLVDTRGSVYSSEDPTYGWGRTFVQGATVTGGKLQPKNGGASVPDMVIDLSGFLSWANPLNTALQANVTVAGADKSGFLAVYSGTYRGTSSLNYGPTQFAIANFTQTPVQEDLKISVKTQVPVIVIVDVVGYVLADWTTQITFPGGAMANARSATPPKTRRSATPRRTELP